MTIPYCSKIEIRIQVSSLKETVAVSQIIRTFADIFHRKIQISNFSCNVFCGKYLPYKCSKILNQFGSKHRVQQNTSAYSKVTVSTLKCAYTLKSKLYGYNLQVTCRVQLTAMAYGNLSVILATKNFRTMPSFYCLN